MSWTNLSLCREIDSWRCRTKSCSRHSAQVVGARRFDGCAGNHRIRAFVSGDSLTQSQLYRRASLDHEPSSNNLPFSKMSMEESISLEETNKIRISLGLKPLTDDKAPADNKEKEAEENYAKKREEEAKEKERK